MVSIQPDVVHVMRKVLRPGDTFIDVGANVGLYTKLGSELVGPEGSVIAFEPDTRALAQLLWSVDSNVTVVGEPCWDKVCHREFCECEDSGGSALWEVERYKGNVCINRRVMETTVLRDHIKGDVRLIKIDAEGADQRIIEGMIPATAPLIIAELNAFGLRQCGCSVESFLRCVHDIGYHVYVMNLDGSGAQPLLPGQTITSPYIHNVLLSMRECVDRMLWP